VEPCIYLGSVLSSDGYSSPDINRRIGLASSVMSALIHIWKDQHLSLTTKTRIYQALVISVLLYAAETWTLLDADSIALEACHIKCQRQLLQIKLQQFIWNNESSPVCHRSVAATLFGRVARLQEDVPAHKALNCHVDISLGCPPSSQWSRHPGHFHNRWVDQLR